MSRLFSLSCRIPVISFRHYEKLSISENKANPAVPDRILCNISLRHNLQVDVNFVHATNTSLTKNEFPLSPG